jgi:ATP-dependent DNA helicase RecQ
VSQWGHDFRPAFLAIRDAIQQLGSPPVLALTATATPEVIKDILKQLAIEDVYIVNLGIERNNLLFEVYRTVNDEEKFAKLLQILRDTQDGPGIIYVPTVRQANVLWQRLCKEGIRAGCYHGKMKAGAREQTQQAFMHDEFAAIVATKAFGLGIDKPNLRVVVHYAFPDSLESYVQETGRAGRDGKPARAVLLYRLEDRRIQAYFLGGKYPHAEDSQRVYRAMNELLKAGSADTVTLAALMNASGLPKTRVRVIVALLEAMGIVKRGRRLHKLRDFRAPEELNAFLEEYEHRHDSDRDRLNAMMRYGQSTMCRVRYLTRYFGSETARDCGHCDNCRDGVTKSVVDIERLVRATHQAHCETTISRKETFSRVSRGPTRQSHRRARSSSRRS